MYKWNLCNRCYKEKIKEKLSLRKSMNVSENLVFLTTFTSPSQNLDNTKTSQECETALTSKYKTLFLFFVFLPFCLFAFLSFHLFCLSVFLYFCLFIFLSDITLIISLRTSSLESHSLCQNSKVAVSD